MKKTLARPPAVAVAWVKRVLFFAALIPLAELVAGVFLDTLGANPIETITRSSGKWTLIFLMLTLTVTPLRRALNWPWLLQLRRMLGLFAFFYVSLHFLTYIWLDQFFDFGEIVRDVIKRPFITVGFTSFILMIPLAATSNDAMVRRLGAVRWQRLHRLVYLIAVGGVVHFWWLVKADIGEPASYALYLAVLLGMRVVWWLKRRQETPRGAAQSKAKV